MGQALSSTPNLSVGSNSVAAPTDPFASIPNTTSQTIEQNNADISFTPTRWRRRRSHILGRLRHSRSNSSPSSSNPIVQTHNANRRSRLLQRAHSSISMNMPTVFRRHFQDRTDESTSSLLLSPTRFLQPPSLRHTLSAPSEMEMPSSPLATPNMDIDESEISLPRLMPMRWRPPARTPSSLITDRLSSLRPERLSRTMSNSLRRRRTVSSPSDDQIPALSQLLSAAAAATAQSLMGDDPNAIRNARGIGGDEGTLESFLDSLQNGRMADALNRTAGAGEGESTGPTTPSVNFVRLFRFGTPPIASESAIPNIQHISPSPTEPDRPATTSHDGQQTSSEARMIPIIIVGIRSINPASNSQDDPNFPSIFDAITGFPDLASSPEFSSNNHHRLTPSTRISHRRRSLGGLAGYDNQRHHRLPDFARPFSSTSEASAGPRPPPSTPASAGMSAFSSGTTTPIQNSSSVMGSTSAVPSRRGSVARSIPVLEALSDQPTLSSRRTPRHRRLSESDFIPRWGSGSSRRNGVVEPDDSNYSASRSWIIYVLGGSYPENHPLLNTPSLFTDQPTYEDMLLLSSLIGPANPPVASQDDVASAAGLFTLKNGEYPGSLIGTCVDNDDFIVLSADERCLICLCDFAKAEEARKLQQCNHIFHKECIDQVNSLLWLHSIITSDLCYSG